MTLAVKNPLAYEQINPSLSAEHLDRMLNAFHSDTIWDWVLLVQDLLMFPYELEFLRDGRLFGQSPEILDISWGKGRPVVSHLHDFPGHHVTEVGISLHYLFQGQAKAKKIASDVKQALEKDQHFDWIRVYLVSQHIRQHGVFLEALAPLLKDRGCIYIIDGRDELISFSPRLPLLQNMYAELRQLQKSSGGLRSAAERILKRASTFGFSLEDSAQLPCPTRTPQDKLNYFRMMCLHVDIISRSFPGKFQRVPIFQEIKAWYDRPDSWGCIGQQLVLIRKKNRRGKPRLKQSA